MRIGDKIFLGIIIAAILFVFYCIIRDPVGFLQFIVEGIIVVKEE